MGQMIINYTSKKSEKVLQSSGKPNINDTNPKKKLNYKDKNTNE